MEKQMKNALRFLGASILALAASSFVTPPKAAAGGYDTPMLYSARHLGMGGTAVAYVDDPSALFHNPAGLSGTDKLTLMGDFSLLVGTITGNPAAADENLTSETTVAPLFLAGGSGRINEWLTVGLAVYPVASAGATYAYDGGTDSTTLVFMEVSPGVALEIPNTGLSFGVGYRITYASLDRQRNVGTQVGLDLSGLSFAGFRVGAKYEFSDHFSVGLAYRHKTVTEMDGDGFLIDSTAIDTWSGSFTLPSRFSLGTRADFGAFGAAIDVEYALQSQNDRGRFTAEGGGIPITSVSAWSNAWTVRIGAEYRLLEGKLPIRLGFIWDQQTSNRAYPTAFGTPPAATVIGTIGVGYNAGPWQANVAYAFRSGSATIATDEIGRGCASCGFGGEYSIALNGLYVDFSYHFGRGATRESGSGVVYGPEWEIGVEAAPATAAPAVETPAVEAPAIEAPAIEAPAVDAPAIEAPVDSAIDAGGDAVDGAVDAAGDAAGDVIDGTDSRIDTAGDALTDEIEPTTDRVQDAVDAP